MGNSLFKARVALTKAVWSKKTRLAYAGEGEEVESESEFDPTQPVDVFAAADQLETISALALKIRGDYIAAGVKQRDCDFMATSIVEMFSAGIANAVT